MRKPFVAGNWKMNKTLTQARDLVRGIRDSLGNRDDVDVLLCPPAPLLFPMAKALADSPIMLGGQNAHEEREGAFTGEISVPMLKDTGCTHVIVGHSERRHVFAEGADRLGKKVAAVVGEGLTVIYCVDETLDERDTGKTRDVIARQLAEAVTRQIPAALLVIAYEPVWAIGTGKVASPDQAQDVHKFIRGRLSDIYDPETADRISILYGGSVKPGNAGELLAQPDIDGALVGGACLVANDFAAIIDAATVAI